MIAAQLYSEEGYVVAESMSLLQVRAPLRFQRQALAPPPDFGQRTVTVTVPHRLNIRACSLAMSAGKILQEHAVLDLTYVLCELPPFHLCGLLLKRNQLWTTDNESSRLSHLLALLTLSPILLNVTSVRLPICRPLLTPDTARLCRIGSVHPRTHLRRNVGRSTAVRSIQLGP